MTGRARGEDFLSFDRGDELPVSMVDVIMETKESTSMVCTLAERAGDGEYITGLMMGSEGDGLCVRWLPRLKR